MDRRLVLLGVFAAGALAMSVGAACGGQAAAPGGSSSGADAGPDASSGSSSGGTGSGSGGAASSSSSGAEPATQTTGCSYTQQGQAYCFLYSDLTAAQQSALDMDCSQLAGTTVTACPTAGEVGCCAYAMSGYDIDQCAYSCPGETAGPLLTECTSEQGAWTNGPSACAEGDDAGDGGGEGGSPDGAMPGYSSGCVSTQDGVMECYVSSGLTATQASALDMACTQTLMGMLVASCPTAGSVGCCSSVSGGNEVDQCYYGCGASTSSAYALACAKEGGSWTAGPVCCGCGLDASAD